ncbi:hypothetical protein BDF14DRAFT_1760608 [Spinellus fusiger]|nr:hypothetical protein BDF14DRAFT_1760608 [Spinellus fusiger]
MCRIFVLQTTLVLIQGLDSIITLPSLLISTLVYKPNFISIKEIYLYIYKIGEAHQESIKRVNSVYHRVLLKLSFHHPTSPFTRSNARKYSKLLLRIIL